MCLLKEACQKSLTKNNTELCALVEEDCCKGSGNFWYGCNMYAQICTENPFKFTCNLALESCCNPFSVLIPTLRQQSVIHMSRQSKTPSMEPPEYPMRLVGFMGLFENDRYLGMWTPSLVTAALTAL